ncbi:hypothetical protein [Gordonia amicalis]|uniref:hypothetical protein n=1 Tax=Gordonia amicalis TaxID=89053 RepID=UPI003A7F6A31
MPRTRGITVGAPRILGQESTSHSNDLPDADPTVDGETGEEFSPIRLDTETLNAGTRLSGQV